MKNYLILLVVTILTFFITSCKVQVKDLHQKYVIFEKQMDSLDNVYNKMSQGYSDLKDIHKKAEFGEKLRVKFNSNIDFMIKGIAELSNTEEILAYINGKLYLFENDYSTFTKIVNFIKDKAPEGELKSKILKKYKDLDAKQLRGQAPDFSLPDLNGEIITLSDFRGKYVLLDFWASWCAPCRAKNKELFEIYPDLKAKGLIVISLSLDNNREQWLKALKSDNVTWIQLVDLKGFDKSKIKEMYKIEQVPTVYFINPKGEIICKNPSLEFINKTLKK